MIKSIVNSNQYIIALYTRRLIGYWKCDVACLWEGFPKSLKQTFPNNKSTVWLAQSVTLNVRVIWPIWPIHDWHVLLTCHGWPHSWRSLSRRWMSAWRRKGHCQKAAQSISEFIRQLTCRRQYRLIITGVSPWKQMLLGVTSPAPAFW